MPQSGSAFSVPMYSKKLAKPSLSQRSSHQSIVTMFPNHWKNTTKVSFEDQSRKYLMEVENAISEDPAL